MKTLIINLSADLIMLDFRDDFLLYEEADTPNTRCGKQVSSDEAEWKINLEDDVGGLAVRSNDT